MASPPFEAFPLSHRKRRNVERAFKLTRLRRVGVSPVGPPGECYWTLDAHVRRPGGEAVYGWQVLQWPRLLVIAVHHAIWRTQEGALVDLTTPAPTDKRGYSTFAADDAVPVSMERPVLAPNRYYPLLKAPEVAFLIALSATQFEDRRRSLEHILAQPGAVWTAGGVRGPAETVGELGRAFRRENQERAREMDLAIARCVKLARRQSLG